MKTLFIVFKEAGTICNIALRIASSIHLYSLTKFSKSNDKLKIVAGFMDGKILDEKEVSVIATLPSLEEARAKIVGILASPAQKLVSILLAPGSKIANLARAKSLKN